MTDLQSFTLMMASAQVVKTSVNTNNSPSQDYTKNPDGHSNHNIDSPGFKPFNVITLNSIISAAREFKTYQGIHMHITQDNLSFKNPFSDKFVTSLVVL